jgi:hypothetical protein
MTKSCNNPLQKLTKLDGAHEQQAQGSTGRMPTFNLTAIEYSDTRHEVAKKKKYGTSILLTQPLNLY